jgi:hypothetical protein
MVEQKLTYDQRSLISKSHVIKQNNLPPVSSVGVNLQSGKKLKKRVSNIEVVETARRQWLASMREKGSLVPVLDKRRT